MESRFGDRHSGEMKDEQDISGSSLGLLDNMSGLTNISTKEDSLELEMTEFTAEINKQEFISGSKIAEQLSIDEARWLQDRTYCTPATNPEKQTTDFGSLSGIIGDLSVESCVGGKMSFGQYFQRKSDNIGILGSNKKVKPSFGLFSETPVKTGKIPVLVESTIMADATASSTELTEKENSLILNATRDIGKNSVISLSTVNTLQDVNSETLRPQIGICKIQIIDTEIPIIVPRQQGKLVNILNSGNVATHVSATIVSIEGHPNTTQDFSIKPDNIFLKVGEKSSFLIVYKPQFSDANCTDDERYAKIKLAAGNNVYHYIISTEQRLLELEKENYLCCHTSNNVVSLSPAASPQSITSNRSGSFDRNSLISTVSSIAVAGNIIPIRATLTALAWNSVKTKESEIKEFLIRNTSNNKIKIQVDICDDSKSFKFLGDEQTINTSMVLAMQRQEMKTLAVVFSPYCVGPVVGKITIKHYTRESNDSQQYKKIPLYGYGGCSKVKIAGTFKDASGKILSLGNLNSETTTLSANIRLDNSGDLRSFAKITVIPKVICSTMNSSWYVNPKEVILNSKESQQIAIQFHPKKEDFALLQRSEVSHVATINVTYGDEPTRWRIRRLYNEIKKSGESLRNENEAFMRPICKAFPGEQLDPAITSIRDSIQNLSDLCTGVHQSEIMLTVEACADDTLFTVVEQVASLLKLYDRTQHPELQGDQFTVTPSTIILNPPIQNDATVTVFSFLKTAETFQTSLSNSDYFSVVPAEGILPSKKSFPLKIQCSQRIERNMQAILEIYTGNKKKDVLIKVVVRR